MPGFASVKDLVDAELAGKTRFSSWRKSPTQTTTSGIWFDLSMSPGNPAPQYYAAAPLVATVMTHTSDGGLFHGKAVGSDSGKYLRKCMAMSVLSTAVPLPMILCDYLMYYPFIDESLGGDVQVLDNTATLTRYTDGEGVMAMAVVVAGHAVGTGVTFTMSYTNSSGVSGRTSRAVQLNTQFVNGTIITTASATANCNGPFIPLQTGDTGIRSIESVTMSGSDVGLFSLVLVKPLAQMSIRGIDAPVEVDYFKDFGGGMPKIEDDAYLNFICHPVGTLNAANINGYIETVWS
jgi:hypothetical protein